MTNPKNEKLHDLTPREVLTFVPLLIMAFWIGLYPKPFFQILEQPVNQIVQAVRNPQAGGAGAIERHASSSGSISVSTEMPAEPSTKGKN